MAFSKFFKRAAPDPQAGARAPGARRGAVAADIEAARAQARRRLIGAAVLLALGILAFPLIFETQPRPIPVDLPIEIPDRDRVAPLTPPKAPARSAARAASPAEADAASAVAARAPAFVPPAVPAGLPPQATVPVQAPEAAASEVVVVRAPTGIGRGASQAGPSPAPTAAAAASKPAARPVAGAASAVVATAARVASAASAAVAAVARGAAVVTSTVPSANTPSTAPAAADKEDEAKPDPGAGDGRHIVQVGAFADAAQVREVRAKVEKLGFKTYTQVVQTAQGPRTRVRIGPYASNEAAQKALAKLKQAGLPGAVLAL